MKRVLIASPVKQKEAILKEFLCSLQELDKDGLAVTYFFIDNNEKPSDLLYEFKHSVPEVHLIQLKTNDKYQCDETTHYWREELMWKVAHYKNLMLKYAKKENFDYIFLVDSDLVMHPATLVHLVSVDKDIVSEVCWTRWAPTMPPLPQVWINGQYRLYKQKRGEKPSDDEIAARQYEFINMLRQPGTYHVGGLGACTLISRKAIHDGVSFEEIYNLDYIGEDRHFCVRAAVLGFKLYADTHYPVYHIYRETDVEGVAIFKQAYIKKREQKKITLAMLVRNEAQRYLSRVLSHAVQFVDHVVILDDASTDNTLEICQKELANIPHTIRSNAISGFYNEVVLRKKLWQMACETCPDWIIILDADEMFEDSMVSKARILAVDENVDAFCFRLYDMWDESHYRDDAYWCAHRVYRPFMVKYNPIIVEKWLETPQHCGRFPQNYFSMNRAKSEIRLKHLGWIKPCDRIEKYFRYRQYDPYAIYGIKEQYVSILDPCPKLSRF